MKDDNINISAGVRKHPRRRRLCLGRLRCPDHGRSCPGDGDPRPARAQAQLLFADGSPGRQHDQSHRLVVRHHRLAQRHPGRQLLDGLSADDVPSCSLCPDPDPCRPIALQPSSAARTAGRANGAQGHGGRAPVKTGGISAKQKRKARRAKLEGPGDVPR